MQNSEKKKEKISTTIRHVYSIRNIQVAVLTYEVKNRLHSESLASRRCLKKSLNVGLVGSRDSEFRIWMENYDFYVFSTNVFIGDRHGAYDIGGGGCRSGPGKIFENIGAIFFAGVTL